jgi:hypothetical protein
MIFLNSIYLQIGADAALRPGAQVDPEEQAHFDDFFEEVFCELEDQYGEIEVSSFLIFSFKMLQFSGNERLR